MRLRLLRKAVLLAARKAGATAAADKEARRKLFERNLSRHKKVELDGKTAKLRAS